jgi:hypothetical protein
VVKSKSAKNQQLVNSGVSKSPKAEIIAQPSMESVTPKSNSRAPTPELCEVYNEGIAIQDYEELEDLFEAEHANVIIQKAIDVKQDLFETLDQNLDAALNLEPLCIESLSAGEKQQSLEAQVMEVVPKANIFKPEIHKAIVETDIQ